MTTIRVEIELDDEVADPGDRTGLTNEAFEEFMDAMNQFGTIANGPEKIA